MKTLKRQQKPAQVVSEKNREKAIRFSEFKDMRAVFELSNDIEKYKGFNNSFDFIRYNIDGIEFFRCKNQMGAKAINMMASSRNIYSYSPSFRLDNFDSLYVDFYESWLLFEKLLEKNLLIAKTKEAQSMIDNYDYV